MAQAGDAVVEQPPARLQQPRERARVDVDLLLADVLDHADRGDRVEALAGEVAVVHDADLDPVGDAGLLGPLARPLGLRRREGDADDAGAVLGRRPEREAAPAAADVEHPVALLQRQLAGDRLQLLFLRRLQRLRTLGEEGAAVGHRLVEEEGEEVVGDVVVVANGAGVALLAVAAAAEDELGGGAAGRALDAGGAHRAERQSRHVAAIERRRLPGVEQLDHRVHVVDLDLAADVGAAEAELARRAQGVCGGSRRADEEGRAVAVGGRQLGSVPELDRERALRDAVFDLAAQRRGAGEGH